MRSRNIKPGFFKNERLAELPPEARLLFIGLWCLSDREGRLEDRPKRIKAELFPYENRNVNVLLDKLYQAGFIVRYKVDQSGFILILKFKCHQHCHPNEKPSIIPAPGDIRKLPEDSITNQADSLLMNTDIPDSRKLTESEFDRFWMLYPKKAGKGQARRAWDGAVKKADAKTIIANLERLLPSLRSQERQYVKNPSTWLNGECWEDETDGHTTADDELDALCNMS